MYSLIESLAFYTYIWKVEQQQIRNLEIMMNKILSTLFVIIAFATITMAQIKVVAPNGDVGMGVDNPTEKLDVNGNINVRGSNVTIGSDAAGGAVGVDVGVGRSANGSATFDFVSDVSNYAAWGFRLLRGSTGVSRFSHRGTNDFLFATNDAAEMRFLTDNTTRMTISAGGQVDIAGSATVNGGVAVTSDRRLKDNVRNFKLGLEEVLAMNPVSFQYNGQGGTSATDRPFVGLIAQELQEIAPVFVSDHEYVEKDDMGKVVSSETYLKIHDSEIKYLLVNAIKDQQKIIESQEAVISDLEERLSKIEESLSNHNTDVQNEILEKGSVLFQNIPNPASSTTTINYEVPSSANNAQINVVDSKGSIVKNIALDNMGKGSVSLNIEDLPSGIYHYTLVVDGSTIETKKMVLNK